jgi:hypothetical protein
MRCGGCPIDGFGGGRLCVVGGGEQSCGAVSVRAVIAGVAIAAATLLRLVGVLRVRAGQFVLRGGRVDLDVVRV